MRFTWIGGPSFLLEIGPFRVIGDPVLAEQFGFPGAGVVTRLTAPPPLDPSPADLVLVTSTLTDHFDADAIARCSAPTVLLPPGAGPEVPGKREIQPPDSFRLEKENAALVVTAVPAGTTVHAANGYFLRFEKGERPFTIYVTGDARFSEETREIQRVHGYSNLLVLYLGAELEPDGSPRSADSKDAMQIVYRMQPNAIAAVHHSTFSHYREQLEPFVEKIALTIYDKRLRKLREGESFEKTIGPSE